MGDSPTGCRRAHACAPLGDYGLTWRQEDWENHHPTSVVLRRHHRYGIITATQKIILTLHHITSHHMNFIHKKCKLRSSYDVISNKEFVHIFENIVLDLSALYAL